MIENKYKVGSREFIEEAKRLGLTPYEYRCRLVQEGKLPNPTEIRRDHDDKLAQKKGYKDHREYCLEKYHRWDYVPKLLYHPCSKEYQEEAKKLGLSGYQYYRKLIEEGKLIDPNDIERIHRNDLARDKGYKDNLEYLRKNRDNWAKNRGYENDAERQRERDWNKGKTSPMSENDDCASHLGVFIGENIAEPILIEIFGYIEKRMYYSNSGYDYIVNGGYKIDVKTSKLHNKEYRWVFDIYHNHIADYFLLLAFDNRNDKNLIHVLLIKGDNIIRDRKFNMRSSFPVKNDPKYMDDLYEYDFIDKLKCIKDIQNKLKQYGDI